MNPTTAKNPRSQATERDGAAEYRPARTIRVNIDSGPTERKIISAYGKYREENGRFLNREGTVVCVTLFPILFFGFLLISASFFLLKAV